MYFDNNDFVSWMEKLSTKLNEIGKDLKSFTSPSNGVYNNEGSSIQLYNDLEHEDI